jgi:hypothetical protein
LGDALDQQHARIDHPAGKVAGQDRIGGADVLDRLRAHSGDQCGDPVQEGERVAMGKQSGDLVNAQRRELFGRPSSRHRIQAHG